ncbi:MAG: hypothetical protein QM811_26825 [Pirellulales bacterium]
MIGSKHGTAQQLTEIGRLDRSFDLDRYELEIEKGFREIDPSVAQAVLFRIDMPGQGIVLEGNVPTFYSKQLMYRILTHILPGFLISDRTHVQPA